MKKVIERIVESPGAPNENDLWLNGTTLKKFENGEWIDISGKANSDSDDIRKINLSPDVDDLLDMMAEKEYFTIEAIENNTKVYFLAHMDNDGDEVILQVEISTDLETWTKKSSSYDRPGALLATLNAGQKLFIRGNNSTYGCEDDEDDPNGSSIYCDKDFYAYGNMMSLIDGDNAIKGIYTNTPGDYTFSYFFKGSNVCSHPTKNLVLPLKTLPDYAYYDMFYYCKKLKRAPSILATTQGSSSMSGMFLGCTSLEIAPRKLYINPVGSAYGLSPISGMFNNCTSLKKSPIIFIDDISGATFVGCTNLKEIINLGISINQFSSKDWSQNRWYCPSETGIIYKRPDASIWDEIKLPDGWILKDAEIVYE